jgi:hypothetical protein
MDEIGNCEKITLIMFAFGWCLGWVMGGICGYLNR